MTKVPAGVTIRCPLRVKVTCFCSAMRFLVGSQNHFRGLVRAFPVQMVFKFVAPLLDDADGGQSRGIAQWAECAPEHIFRKLVNQRNIFRAAAALVETVQHLAQPSGAFAARGAPAARLGRAKNHYTTGASA